MNKKFTAENVFKNDSINEELKTKNILIVEDDICLMPFFEKVLKNIKHDSNICWATTANEAMTLLGEKNFDLMISDINLPNLVTGLDLWGRIRSTHPYMKVIFTSAVNAEDYIKSFTPSEYCPPFISKPFRRIEIINVINSAFEKKKFSVAS